MVWIPIGLPVSASNRRRSVSVWFGVDRFQCYSFPPTPVFVCEKKHSGLKLWLKLLQKKRFNDRLIASPLTPDNSNERFNWVSVFPAVFDKANRRQLSNMQRTWFLSSYVTQKDSFSSKCSILPRHWDCSGFFVFSFSSSFSSFTSTFFYFASRELYSLVLSSSSANWAFDIFTFPTVLSIANQKHSPHKTPTRTCCCRVQMRPNA